MKCEYCCTFIPDEELKSMPDDLPDDLPWSDTWDYMPYHSWCFENAVSDYRMEIYSKHIADCSALS